MITFTEWIEINHLHEGFLNKWAAPAILAGASLFGANNQNSSAQGTQQTQQTQPIKNLGNNTYEVTAIGRKSKIGGPTYHFDQAKMNAKLLLMKHLNIKNGNFSIETLSHQDNGNSVSVTYKIKLL